MVPKVELRISEKIDRARDGRSQTWLVNKLKERGIKINEVQFSRKKNGHISFTEEELTVLSSILNVQF